MLSLFRVIFTFFIAALSLVACSDEQLTDDVSVGGGALAASDDSSEDTSEDSSDDSSDDSDSSGDDSTDGSSTVEPDDDDFDGISNAVEASFGMLSRTADTDEDGFSDGLEFVADRGDPLDGSLTPTSQARERIIPQAQSTLDTDSDGDGLGNTFENNNGLDSTSADSDADGYGDGLELVAGSNPLSSSSVPLRLSGPSSDGIQRDGTPPVDTDSDGIADSLETLTGTRTDSSDTDSDGFSDGLEFLFGSSGIDALSIPDVAVPAP